MGSRPDMGTTHPWQVFAWTATRYGKLYISVDLANLTRDGASVRISRLRARGRGGARTKLSTSS